MEWIDVKQELPPNPDKRCGGLRLIGCVQFENGPLSMELIYGSDGHFFLQGVDFTDAVSHWMYLPKPINL